MSKRRTSSKLFVVSAPSGCGKTTLCNKLLSDGLGLVHSVSMTTRPPRSGEKGGEAYHFVSEKTFKDIIKKNGFLEYEENFGYLYGTPKKFIEKNLGKNRPILLNIDVKGATKVRKAYPEDSVLIFILPPSINSLKKRLKARRTDSHQTIEMRLKLARKEMAHKDRYDYSIVNDRLDSAYRRLKGIIISELK